MNDRNKQDLLDRIFDELKKEKPNIIVAVKSNDGTYIGMAGDGLWLFKASKAITADMLETLGAVPVTLDEGT